MRRFILRYTGGGAAPPADVDAILGQGGLTVVDRTPRMLLVDAAPSVVDRLVGALRGWVSAPERSLPVPDVRPKVRRAPA